MQGTVFSAIENAPAKLIVIIFLLCLGMGTSTFLLLAVSNSNDGGFASRTEGCRESVEVSFSTVAKVPLQTRVEDSQSPGVDRPFLFGSGGESAAILA